MTPQMFLMFFELQRSMTEQRDKKKQTSAGF